MQNKFCLVCDDVAVIEVLSLELQSAPLCGLHWADYCTGPQSLAHAEVDKYFEDGRAGDRAESLTQTVARYSPGLRTDEERGRYDATQKAGG